MSAPPKPIGRVVVVGAGYGGATAAKYLRFFFQAEDGIRDKLVTGVQTCALPIYCELGGVLGACREMRPANRGARSVHSARFSPTLRGIPRGTTPSGPRRGDAAGVSVVRVAAAFGRPAAGRRRRQAIFGLFLLFAGMGVSPDSLPHVRRRSREQAAGLRRGAVPAHSRGSLRYLQILSPHH